MIILWFFVGLTIGCIAGYHVGWVEAKGPTPSSIDALDLTKRDTYLNGSWDLPEGIEPKAEDSTFDIKGSSADFAVTGTPRHIPWNRRKKELEQAARQKRRQLESFREEA